MYMIYVLLHKDISVCVFDLEIEVTSAVINTKTAMHLPLPLKRIIHYQTEFVQEEQGDQLILNDEGCSLVDFWINDRTIPANRKNLKNYLGNSANRLAWMLDNHACSLDDCYWIKSKDEHMTWDDVKLYGYEQIDILTQERLAEKAHYKSGANSTLGGELDKYWFCDTTKNDKTLYICKRTSPADDILSIREIIASHIYDSINYENHCKYEYVYNKSKQIVGCYCKAFTNETLELVTAYDLLEEYNFTQQDDLYSIVVDLAAKYGMEIDKTREYLDIQTMVDYLITNRDRHQGNIGFLRDPDSLQIIRSAPVYDSGSSASMEYELPIDIENTTVNGLYHTEKECLDHVTDLKRIDLSILPSSSDILKELNKSSTLNAERIDFFVRLYERKIETLMRQEHKCDLSHIL